MTLILDLLIISALFLIQAAFVILVAGPIILLKPVRRKSEWYTRFTNLLEPKDAGIPQENITFETIDGLKLHGWLVYQKKKAKGTIIYLHGVGDCKIGGVPFAHCLYNAGYNILLYDSRQHGESEGYYCTYGFYEKYDVSSAISFLESQKKMKIGKIGIYGTSMGGSVAIQAAAIDPRISIVVSEGSFTALRIVFVDYQKRIIKMPWHFLRNIALVQAQKMANFKARLVSPIDDIKRVHVPIMIVHGKNDKFIKSEYAKQLFESANEPKKLILVDNAGHNDVWETGSNKYHQIVVEFFGKYLVK